MLKKIGIPVVALLGILAFAPHQAKAAVRFGVVVGRPAYTYPVYPVVPPVVVAAPAPVFVDGAWVGRGVRRDWDHDRDARFHRDYRDHDRDFRDRR